MKNITKIYQNHYKSFEKFKPLGIRYPTEALVVYVSNLRKNKNNYFADQGKEYSANNNFHGNALDLGFGSISNLLMLRDKGFSCYGAEVSDEAVKRGRFILKKKNITDIKLKTFRKSKLKYKKNFFDIISGMQCIYYNLNLKKFIDEEIYRILKPQGKFIFSFFSKDHSYLKWSSKYKKNIFYFNKLHPNKRLYGSKYYFVKDKKKLIKLFNKFKKVKVFKTTSNQTHIKENWWYIVGEK